MKIFEKITATNASSAVILIRLMVGAVFLSEGIQKFTNLGEIGAGRFAKIGFGSPELVASFVAGFEIVCGLLILSGFLVRLAVVPTIIIMLVAISTTKIPILFEKGFWAMAHESRTDFSMLLGSLFLLIVGAGAFSLDRKFFQKSNENSSG